MAKQTPTESQRFQVGLNKVVSQIHQYQSFDLAFPHLEPLLLKLFRAERITVYQRNRLQQDIVSRFKSGDEVAEIRVPVSTASIAGFVALSRKPLLIRDVRDAEELKKYHPNLRFNAAFEKNSSFSSHSMIVVPVEYNGVLLGVLQLINRDDGSSFIVQEVKRARQLAILLAQKFKYDLGCTEGPFDYLLDQQLLTEEQLQKAEAAASEKLPVSRILKEQYQQTTENIGRSLEYFYQVPFLHYEPEKYGVHPVAEGIKAGYLQQSRLALLQAETDDKVWILIDDPNDVDRVMEIQKVIGNLDSQLAVGVLDDIYQYLGMSVGGSGGDHNLDTILGEMSEDDATLMDDNLQENEEVSEEDSTVVRLVNRILMDARQYNASDIHIEPGKGRSQTRVRMRIDGVCQDIIQIPAAHAKATVSRIKIMSHLDIAEKRKPQDGKFGVRLKGQALEVRVATIPTVNGEGVVLRLLQSGEPIPFNKLNLSKPNQEGLKDLLSNPHGILLVVGPTGSGKTTTLHALLATLNTPERKIWTAEDPVEITQPGLQQVQVKPKIGFDFAAALRAFLRADPDVILIGEMRDKETANAGIEASLTGHLVLSTLHTNSAPETITRLLDLGMDPVSFSDALLGVLAQRLVRTLCGDCKEQYTASADDIAFLRRQYGEQAWDKLKLPDGLKLWKAVGCKKCNNTGYRGRTGIHELLTGTVAMRELIYRSATAGEVHAQAVNDGMRTLVQDGVEKVLKGDTDFDQIRRVAGGH